MSGYNRNRSRSNRAVAAEKAGKLPLTRAIRAVAAAVGCTQKEARDACQAVGSREWHHSSKFYNPVDYYSVPAVVAYMRAQPVIAAWPIDWRERMDIPRRARLTTHEIDLADERLAAELGTTRDFLERAYDGTWADAEYE